VAHQPLLFKKIIKKLFLFGETYIKLTSKFHIKLTSKFHITLTLKKFEFSYQNVEKYKKKLILIGGLICWKFSLIGGIWRFLIRVWPLYRSKCIPNTYQIFITNTYQTPISLSCWDSNHNFGKCHFRQQTFGYKVAILVPTTTVV
jgi:hypothetical protein